MAEKTVEEQVAEVEVMTVEEKAAWLTGNGLDALRARRLAELLSEPRDNSDLRTFDDHAEFLDNFTSHLRADPKTALANLRVWSDEMDVEHAKITARGDLLLERLRDILHGPRSE